MKLVAAILAAACTAAVADSPKQDESLAAIQKAMNELAPASQQCWAAAATDRYDIAGAFRVRIAIGPKPIVTVLENATGSDRIATCMTALLQGYRWAPPLAGQTIELPFAFKAPNGQSVIDRRLVESHAQGKIAVSVLIDQANSGNAAAAMFDVAIARGGTTEPRWVDGAELWLFLTPAEVRPPEGSAQPIAAGDMMFAPDGSVRAIAATSADVRAVAVYVPGGTEGIARAGALPNRRATTYLGKPNGPIVLTAKHATTYGPATIFLDDAIARSAYPWDTTSLAASILQLPAGAKIAEHVHAHETELLYILAGSGTLTVAGNALPITAASVVQIPPNTKHALAVTEPLRALQIYTPAGPEQRFKQ